MISVNSGLAMTCNWIADRKPCVAHNADYNRLIYDSVRALQGGSPVYIYYEEQLHDILKYFKHGIIKWEFIEFYYVIRRK